MRPAEPSTDERTREVLSELAALRDVEPPSSLVARVMMRVATPARPTLWQWLRRPVRVQLPISIAGALALGVAVLAAGTLLVRAREHSETPTSEPSSVPAVARSPGAPANAGDQSVMVRFVFEARGARQVAVAGSFNAWTQQALEPEENDREDRFVATIAVPRGVHQYMFVVDGRWITDPATSERRPDGFGRQNSLLRL